MVWLTRTLSIFLHSSAITIFFSSSLFLCTVPCDLKIVAIFSPKTPSVERMSITSNHGSPSPGKFSSVRASRGFLLRFDLIKNSFFFTSRRKNVPCIMRWNANAAIISRICSANWRIPCLTWQARRSRPRWTHLRPSGEKMTFYAVFPYFSSFF